MRRTIACVAAAALVGTAAACTPKATGLASAGSAGQGNTHSSSATPSASQTATNQSQGAASNGGTTQDSSNDSASYVQARSYSFRTVDDAADPAFNQLLGINNDGVIAGYFGSGAQGHPNMGFRVTGGGRSFVDENVPGSVQTQVTAINDRGLTVGFFSGMNNANQVNDNTGFYARGGSFHRVAFPTADNAAPAVNQLLGVNDSDTAVGFYTDGAGNNHGYEYSVDRHTFHKVTVSGATSTTAAAINNEGDVAGFFTAAGGATDAFLLTHGGRLTDLAYPGASMTQAFGVNDHGEVVGVYQVGTGGNAQTHGFTWTARGSFKQVDDPSGVGTTTVNGVNDAGALVGFYVDGAGNTHGMLATPGRATTVRHLELAAMPTGTVMLDQSTGGTLTAQVNASGLTPGSSHTVEIDAPGQSSPVAAFGSPLTADATGRAQVTLTATGDVSALSYGSRFVIRLGQPAVDPANSALAAEPIARSGRLPARPEGYRSNLSALDVNAGGDSLGTLSGNATVAYDAAAQTLTVTLSATGLTPGAHAAHIHAGTCQSQGAVLYMMMNFQADARGTVVNQTRVITGVGSMPASGTWYLNLHLGGSDTIVANGAPTLNFRPLLCANG